MLTINTYENILCSGVINRNPNVIQVYYNTSRQQFEYHFEAEADNSSLILTPCLYSMKSAIWEEFYSMINETEYNLAQSYPYKRGFFDYLKEVGLYETFKAAENNVAIKAFERWLTVYNITLRDIDIDCSYI